MELRYYILRRLLLLIPTIVGLTLLLFILIRMLPDSILVTGYINPHSTIPVSVQRQTAYATLGLNLPVPVQYFYWISNLVHGNWGYMITNLYTGPVLSGIELFFPNTLELAIFTVIFSTIIAIPLGTYIGARPNSLADQVGRIFSLTGYAMPVFWLGMLSILAFGKGVSGYVTNQLPFYGAYDVPLPTPLWISTTTGISSPTHLIIFDALIHGDFSLAWNGFLHLLLPVLTLTYTVLAGILRFIRAGMVDSARQEYVKTARSKGVPERLVIKRHVRKNALLPTVTVLGLLVAGLLGGVVVTEVVFTYYGIGYFTVQAVQQLQLYGIIDTTFVFGLVLVAANLIVDVIYAFIDPRIRY